ncbi:MAG: hypothetical protein K0V04_26220 [Deltaproteobacteria bacterium]|nr:hypothetical protein [Deltaproteobacteria bacterium]
MRNFGTSLLLSALMAVGVACDAEDDSFFPGDPQLGSGGPLGKEDSAGIASVPVRDYPDTQAWVVRNQWEDKGTAAAKAAGVAWGANSGLTWDEKYARWIESLPTSAGSADVTPAVAQTIQITTPWGRTLDGPRIDCADLALLLRASFAAWYQLPFYVAMYDNSRWAYLGHFGGRVSNGAWSRVPAFPKYDDVSGTPLADGADWPSDGDLRKAKLLGDGRDDQPHFELGRHTGLYLDELHLNKRAAWVIYYIMLYGGSLHLSDSRNTYNLQPMAMREGDFMVWRHDSTSGHTSLVTQVDDVEGGQKRVQSAYGNIPLKQPEWRDNDQTRSDFIQPGTGDSAHSKWNPGLKRFRVAKNKNGSWVNTWMAADEASWINDTDKPKMEARLEEISTMLGKPDPDKQRALLLLEIAAKRTHLQTAPSSCRARQHREDFFKKLYKLEAENGGKTKEQVDKDHRRLEDYVFAQLDYQQAKTCCWNDTNATMFATIMDYNEKAQAAATAAGTCVEPTVFKARDGDYAIFRNHNSTGWKDWKAGEACPQSGTKDDNEVTHEWTPWCTLQAPQGNPPPGGGSPAHNSCEGRCGGASLDNSCYCDDMCDSQGDCCADKTTYC